jgi:hypothetical protein
MISDARGKQGGLVYSRNASGHYVRAKVSPVQPRSALQLAIRNAMCNEAIYWRETLSAVNRAGWERYAKSTPLVDVFGNKAYMSGIAMYLRQAVVRRRAGGVPIYAAPTLPGEANAEICTFTGTVADGVRLTVITPVLVGADYVEVYRSVAATSQARNYYSTPFMFAGDLDALTGLPKPTSTPR